MGLVKRKRNVQDADMSNYSPFYLAGRLENVDQHGISIEQLTEQVTVGPSNHEFREAIARAATAEMANMCDRAARREWQRDRADEFDDLDPEQAWKFYVQGRTDALANQLEDEVLNHIEETDDDDDDDDDDEDNEED